MQTPVEVLVITHESAQSDHKPLIDHCVEGWHDALLPNLEEIGIPSGRLEELKGDGVVWVRGDAGLDKGIEHLPVGSERKF